jgi:hypothetical protein
MRPRGPRSRKTHGYPRVHAELSALGVHFSKKRDARLMRKAGLWSRMRPRMRERRKRTTRRDRCAIASPRAGPRAIHRAVASRTFAWG